MAIREQLELLMQGVDVWNRWREENPTIAVNFSETFLVGENLREVDLKRANLSGAVLWGADLSGAFRREAILYNAQMSRTNLREALLQGVNLSQADLSQADLRGANLSDANLSGANLGEADLSEVLLQATTFANVNLTNTKDLESVKHFQPSTIGTDTLNHSKGKIPEIFLCGCGLSDWEIEAAKLYNPEISNEERNKILYKIYDIQANQPIQISPLFISYSRVDNNFVDRMETALNDKGIRFWRDIHHTKAGRLENQIDRAIRRNPTVLLVLSKNSIQSDWVEHEVNLARKLEREIKRDVLCPIALDDSWKTSPWSEVIMEQVMKYNILDFSTWEDDEKFERMFDRLIDGLNLFYKKEDE